MQSVCLEPNSLYSYGERTPSATDETHLRPALKTSPDVVISTAASIEDGPESDVMKPPTSGWSDIGAYVYEDWFGSDIVIPRDTDRILEQFVLMLLRIGAYLKRGDVESVDSQIFNSAMSSSWHPRDTIDCTTMNGDATETPPHVGSSKGNIASYLREYPQIFMKKQGNLSQTEMTLATLKTVHSLVETDESTTNKNKDSQNSSSSRSHEEMSSGGFGKAPSKKKITISDSITTQEDKSVKLTSPPELQTKRTSKTEETKLKSKLKMKRGADDEKEKYPNEIVNKVLDVQEGKTTDGDFKQTSSECKRKRTRIAILDAGNSKTENETPKEKNDDELTLGEIEIAQESLIQSKQLNTTNICKETSHTTVLQEPKQESELSHFLTAEKNDGRKLNNPDVNIIKENNNRQSTHNKSLNETNHEELNDNGKVSKAVTSGEILKDDSNLTKNKDGKNKEVPLRILSNDDNIRSSLDVEITNRQNTHVHKEISNKELPFPVVSNDDKNLDDNKRKCLYCNNKCTNKELPLRIQSNDDTTTNSLNVKESSKDETTGSTDDKTPKEMGCKIIGCNCQKSNTAKHEENLKRKDHTNF